MEMKLITASLLALCARFAIAQDDNSVCTACAPDPDKILPFTSVVTGPWYPGDPPYQSLAGTKVYARDGRLHLGNETTARTEPRCRNCVKDTVIFVDGDTGKAYLVRTPAALGIRGSRCGSTRKTHCRISCTSTQEPTLWATRPVKEAYRKAQSPRASCASGTTPEA